MSVLIVRYLKQENCELNGAAIDSFTDDGDISDYAKDSVYALKNLGLINGMGDGSFYAEGNATRAQTAQILYSVSLFMKSRNISYTNLTGSDRYMLLAGKFMALDIIPFPNEENGIVTKGQFAKYLAGFVNAKIMRKAMTRPYSVMWCPEVHITMKFDFFMITVILIRTTQYLGLTIR